MTTTSKIIDVNLVSGPIATVWNAIAGDLSELGRVTNAGAIEACIDANRLTEFAFGEKRKAEAAAAEAEIDRAITAVGYTKVLRTLARHIHLV